MSLTNFDQGAFTLPDASTTKPRLDPNDPYDLNILLGQTDLATSQAQLNKLLNPPAQQFAPAQSDPDLLRKQTFQRELETSRATVEKELARIEAERRAAEQQKQQDFSGVENERDRELQRQRTELDRIAQQADQANDQAMRALEAGRLDESRRQFDISQKLGEQRFALEQQVAREEYELGQQNFAFGALKFLTDLAQNPRTALSSFFLNRGVNPNAAVQGASPVPQGLNVTNVAETLPGFLQGILGAARSGISPQGGTVAGASPSSTSATASSFNGGSIVDQLTQAGAVPPFLQRVLAQSQGDFSQGTNMPQQTALPEGLPLVSSLALLQMSPTEREGFRGLVEASGMNWEDYLDMIRRTSPQGATGALGTGAPEFAFTAQ